MSNALKASMKAAARSKMESLEVEIDRLKAELEEARAESAVLAANQCHDGYAGEHGHHMCREVETLRADLAKAKRSYRCYTCKQVFEEDDGHGLAAEHFGNWLKGDMPKCHDSFEGRSFGGPHDPFIHIRKSEYAELEKLRERAEAAESRAREAEAAVGAMREALEEIRNTAFYHMTRHADERGDRKVLGQIKEMAINALATLGGKP